MTLTGKRTYEFVVNPSASKPRVWFTYTWYDNSANNPGNPDPNRNVPWGLQSWDEMLYGAFSYTYVNESTEAPLHDKGLADTTQMVGFMDKDLDGKLSWTELPGYLQKRLTTLSVPTSMATTWSEHQRNVSATESANNMQPAPCESVRKEPQGSMCGLLGLSINC